MQAVSGQKIYDGTQALPTETPRNALASLIEATLLLDTIRKWGIQFDDRDSLVFLERLKNCRKCYGVSPEQLRRCLLLLFKDKALLSDITTTATNGSLDKTSKFSFR